MPDSKSNIRHSKSPDLGALGEEFVTQWLRDRGYQILQQQWHCRWGELDVVAGLPSTDRSSLALLAFVEVKTRSRGNWDAHGALAITAQKQSKLWKTAECFLAEHPEFTEVPCRFDVALVHCRKQAARSSGTRSSGNSTHVSNQASKTFSYQLTLLDYIPDAFTL
ncbi:YraN family protein [Leptolyngbya sp. FACHB-36]|uniref:YraN family protein n=1 Tax=Leptolyngbya sp. FACHB-36 TaxID=2692808 RepID=UPI0016806297|nr:YraN family protein [Leptolyngbya sp. FACHB-36]MBD2022557.1 YraN family protein [Leptolyngbya sp. FACHB-36]